MMFVITAQYTVSLQLKQIRDRAQVILGASAGWYPVQLQQRDQLVTDKCQKNRIVTFTLSNYPD